MSERMLAPVGDTRGVGSDADRQEFVDTPFGHLTLGLVPMFGVMVLWQVVSILRPKQLQFAIPTLAATIDALRSDISSGVLVAAVGITLEEIAIGVVIAAVTGILLGVAIGLTRILDVMFYPLVVFFQSIPKLALAPLLILVFGFGAGSKVAVGAAIGFFPILVGVIQGMRAIRLDEIDLLRSLEASPWQLFWKVRVPRAIPATFAGFQVATIFAMTGVVGTEFLGASAGMGYLIDLRSTRLELPGVYSVLICLSVIGVVINLSLTALDRRLSGWEES